MKTGEQRIVTDIGLNRMFVHEPGMVIKITFIDGTLVGYTVDRALYFTTKIRIGKYSKPGSISRQVV